MPGKHVGEDLEDEQYNVQSINIGDHDLEEHVEDQCRREVLHADDAVAGRCVESVKDNQHGQSCVDASHGLYERVKPRYVVDPVDTVQLLQHEALVLECVKRYKHLKDDVGEEQHVEGIARRKVIPDGALRLDKVLQIVDEKFKLVLDLEYLEFTQLRLIGGTTAGVALYLQPRILGLVLLRALVSVAV